MPSEVTMMHTDDPTAADLREEVSPVSERYGAFELGDAVVVFDDDHGDRWILSDTACDREAMR